MIVKRHIGLPENEMVIIKDTDTLIHNIITPELKEKDKQIDRLTNNWNELEEWVRSLIDYNNDRYELYKYDKLNYEYEISNIEYQNNMLIAFLDKMKEIKDDNNDPN